MIYGVYIAVFIKRRKLTVGIKKLTILLLVMVFMVGFCGIAVAVDISGSAHDFSSGGTGKGAGENPGEICSTCHVPHTAAFAADGPLWDHDVTEVTTFATYIDVNNSLDATLGQPGMASKICLSCHDGTVAIDSFGGATGTILLTSGDSTYVGSDLSDDHPIGFTYDDALVSADGELETASTVISAGFPLFGSSDDRMECATCHDAHDGAATYFLRASNTGSALCTSCHIK